MQDTDTDTAPLGRLQISCDVASTIMDGDQQQRQQEQHRARSTTSSTCVSLVSATGSCVTQVRAHADDDDADDTSECASDAKPGMLVTKDALDSEEASPSTTSCLLLNVGLPPEIMAIVMELLSTADLLTATTVCRYWHACAVPVLWRAPDVFPAGEDGGPVVIQEGHGHGSATATSTGRNEHARHHHVNNKGWLRALLGYVKSNIFGGDEDMLQRRELYRWHSFLYAIDERHRSERMASIEAAEANAEASASATCSFTSLDTADWLSSSAFTSPSATLTSHGFTPSPSYPRISPAACIQALDLSRATAHGVTITDHDIHTIATSCPSLRRLNLSHCPSLTDLALQHLATAPCAQHMEALNLAHCVQVTDAGVVPLVCGMAGSLRALNLKSCTLVGDVALEAVARWCGAGLRRLRVNGCSSVTDEGLMALSERCARLTWLDVGSCPLVSDAGVIPLVMANPNLQWLDVSRTPRYKHREFQITDDTVIAVVDHCKQLELLDVSNCNALTDRSLVYLAANAITLKSLSLKSLHQITAESIMALGDLRRRYRRLIWLQIYNCRCISGEVIDEMIRRLNDGWRKGPYDTNVHREVMNGRSWEDAA